MRRKAACEMLWFLSPTHDQFLHGSNRCFFRGQATKEHHRAGVGCRMFCDSVCLSILLHRPRFRHCVRGFYSSCFGFSGKADASLYMFFSLICCVPPPLMAGRLLSVLAVLVVCFHNTLFPIAFCPRGIAVAGKTTLLVSPHPRSCLPVV